MPPRHFITIIAIIFITPIIFISQIDTPLAD
jgi:hypothetical protein